MGGDLANRFTSINVAGFRDPAFFHVCAEILVRTFSSDGVEDRNPLIQETGICKAIVVVMPQNDVVENSNSKNLPGMNQPLRAVSILSAGGRISGRMVVYEYQCCGAITHRRSKNLPGMNYGCA